MQQNVLRQSLEWVPASLSSALREIPRIVLKTIEVEEVSKWDVKVGMQFTGNHWVVHWNPVSNLLKSQEGDHSNSSTIFLIIMMITPIPFLPALITNRSQLKHYNTVHTTASNSLNACVCIHYHHHVPSHYDHKAPTCFLFNFFSRPFPPFFCNKWQIKLTQKQTASINTLTGLLLGGILVS